MPRTYWKSHAAGPEMPALEAPPERGLVPSSPEAFQQYAMLRLAQGQGLEAARELMARHEGGAESDNARIVRERRMAERGGELEGLRGRGFVNRDAYDAPDLGPARIGVSFRPDGLGAAHTGHDKACLAGVNQVEGAPGLTPVTVPKGAEEIEFPGRKPAKIDKKRRETEEETRTRLDRDREIGEWMGAVNTSNGRVLDTRARALPEDLDDIDGLYLAGAPSAVHTQGGSVEDAGFNAPTGSALDERNSRADYEHDLVARARNTGMPMMGICAGSWRLLEAYGGAVEALPEAQRGEHYKPGADTWRTKHALQSRPNTMVGGTFPVREELRVEDMETGDYTRRVGRESTIDAVNSTHWAVAAMGEDGELRPNDREQRPVPANLARHQAQGRLPVDPRHELEISATAPGEHPTVEAFESRHGAPVIGAQWHPEGYLPGAAGRDGADAGAIEQSEALFRGFAQSARAYRGRKNVNAEFKTKYPPRD